MSSRQNRKPLVLEYKKRRFDGGNERELIEQIERQNQLYENHLGRMPGNPMMGHPVFSPIMDAVSEPSSINDDPTHMDYHGVPYRGSMPVPLPPMPASKHGNTNCHAGMESPFQPMMPEMMHPSEFDADLDDMLCDTMKENFGNKLFRIFMVPVMEIVMGLSGLVIGFMLSSFTFKSKKLDKSRLSEEQRLLFSNSITVFKNGIFGLITSPFAAVKVALTGAA